jgi:hypothetical protein
MLDYIYYFMWDYALQVACSSQIIVQYLLDYSLLSCWIRQLYLRLYIYADVMCYFFKTISYLSCWTHFKSLSK